MEVRKPYTDLTVEEIDPQTGCTVCEQDQVQVHLPPLEPFSVCRLLMPLIEPVFRQLMATGEPILSISGYRVGRTRGEVDAAGLRTRFSNHSYGIALDINPQRNGLYGNCVQFNSSCHLLRGGTWWPGQPGSLTDESPTVIALKQIGMRWGGEISGRQKDFMHFSPTGY